MPEVWKIEIIIPEASFTKFYKYAVGAWMSQALPGPPKLIGEGIEKIIKFSFGGLPIRGTLTITDTAVDIKSRPRWEEKLFTNGNIEAEFSIPIKDIISVSGPKSLVFGIITGTILSRVIKIQTKDFIFFIKGNYYGTVLTKKLKSVII